MLSYTVEGKVERDAKLTASRMPPFGGEGAHHSRFPKTGPAIPRPPQKAKLLNRLKTAKSLTNVLPRFNVHLFLTRGTYSIKISY